MSKQLMDIVLPRLARRLHGQLQRYRTGQMNDAEFTRKFEALLQKQYAWLAEKGVSETQAALAIHGAVLVLSAPGMAAEAKELGVPLEVVEYRAVHTAASDIARNYGLKPRKAFNVIAGIVARYGH